VHQANALFSEPRRLAVCAVKAAGLALGLVFFGQQEGHGAIGFRDNPQLVASVCAVSAQEPEPVL